MARFAQVKGLADLGALRAYLETIGVEIPIDAEVDPAGPLAAPMTITDGAAGSKVVANRWTVLPMEGWDGLTDGRPSDLVRRRWQRFGEGGAGLVWGEATAVRHDGKANPNQLVLNETTVDDMADLRTQLDPSQVTVLQLTHSGRYARPTAHGPAPRTLYRHPLLDDRANGSEHGLFSGDGIAGESAVLSGEEFAGGPGLLSGEEFAGGPAVLSGEEFAGGPAVLSGEEFAGESAVLSGEEFAGGPGLLSGEEFAGGPGLLSDDEIDELVEQFIAAAVLAEQAGFDFVDVKACHGYLGHEFLSAYDRPGRYGGDLDGRSNFLRSVIGGIREAAPQIGVAVRLSLFDFVPHVAGEGGVGRPQFLAATVTPSGVTALDWVTTSAKLMSCLTA